MIRSLLSVVVLTSVATAADLENLSGQIRVDGSSTVYPITEAVAEAFAEEAPNVRVTVGVSGTGGGFKRFAANETDISDASRPIKAKELKLCTDAGIKFIEIPVAYDGLTIVVNKANTWATTLTVDQLKQVFLADSAAKKWKDLDPSWPDTAIKVYSPGTDSGTFDYFKEVIAGKKGAIRSDMSVSEDDNILVNGVVGDTGAIGFFGAAYYFENQDKLTACKIVNPSTGKAVAPNPTTIEDGSYAPFSRPLFIYVNARSARNPVCRSFVEFYLAHAGEMATLVGYVPLPKTMYARVDKNWKARRPGTQFLNEQGDQVSGALTQVYQ